MKLFCKHKYIKSEQTCTQRWTDAPDEYLMVIQCEKCGYAQYKRSGGLSDLAQILLFTSLCVVAIFITAVTA